MKRISISTAFLISLFSASGAQNSHRLVEGWEYHQGSLGSTWEIWPGYFEKFDKTAIHDFMAELNTLAHQLDPSRKTCIRRYDFCKDIVDVYSPSR